LSSLLLVLATTQMVFAQEKRVEGAFGVQFNTDIKEILGRLNGRTMSVDAIKHIMATVFSAQNALRALAPEFKWAGMGNLLGDYGEYICIESYGLTKAPTGASGYDAIDVNGKTVQIKTNHAASMVGYRGEADLFLVIHVDSTGNHEEIYYGDFDVVKENSNFSKRDNKRTITISKLKKLKALTVLQDKL